MQKKKEIWMLQTKRADFNGLAMRLGVSPVAVRIMRNRGLLDEREMRSIFTGHWMIFRSATDEGNGDRCGDH